MVVAFVEVEFRKVTFWRVEEPVTRRLGIVRAPARVRFEIVAFVANKFVLDAFVAKKLVVVAEVPVALTKVKFCKVEEPEVKRLPAVRVPVRV